MLSQMALESSRVGGDVCVTATSTGSCGKDRRSLCWVQTLKESCIVILWNAICLSTIYALCGDVSIARGKTLSRLENSARTQASVVKHPERKGTNSPRRKTMRNWSISPCLMHISRYFSMIIWHAERSNNWLIFSQIDTLAHISTIFDIRTLFKAGPKVLGRFPGPGPLAVGTSTNTSGQIFPFLVNKSRSFSTLLIAETPVNNKSYSQSPSKSIMSA